MKGGVLMLKYYDNYGPYVELVKTQKQVIKTSEITKENLDEHYNSILNIMRDGVETKEFKNSFITVIFEDGIDVDLSIPDYFYNLIMWVLPLNTEEKITSYYLFYEDNITRKVIKKYIDAKFIAKNRRKYENIVLNNIIDDCLSKFTSIDEFSFYLANTINLEDTIDLMNMYPKFSDLLHVDVSNVPIDQVKKVGMDAAEEQIKIIKASDFHCLADFFRANEGVNPKQYKEVFANIGAKPDGKGGIYPIINTNYVTGGTNDLLSLLIEEATGRVAQIIVEGNVPKSGTFARLLGLNNMDIRLHPDPNYTCSTKNFQKIHVKNLEMLHELENKYYRLSPKGMDYMITSKDTHLIDKTIYLRSPMTCSSAAKGEGICYKCYGDLAHTNNDINVGKIAAEELSSKLTQMMLSAKHLLESSVKKMTWSTKNFKKLFEVNYNMIQLMETINYKGYKMIIDPTQITPESDLDDEEESYVTEFNEYINSFDILTPNDEVISIFTADADNLYLSADLADAIRTVGKKYEDDKIMLNLNDIKDIPLFHIKIHNYDLSQTLDMIKNYIDNSKTLEKLNYDKDSLLQQLLEIMISTGLNVSSTHIEVILSNQIRNVDNILDNPNWDYPNEPYNLLTLQQSLTNNPSVIISLSYNYVSKALYTPLTYRKNKPSYMDLFFMKDLSILKKEVTEERKVEGLYNPISFMLKEEEIK